MPSATSIVDGTRPVESTVEKMQLECLELAGCTLDRYISADSSRPSFLELTGVAAHGTATCSGLNAGDYKNLPALLNHPTLSQMKITNKIPLPPEIMEHFAHMQCHCLMGVFPEISRIWLTIDSNIYVWAFENSGDVAYFDGLGETIVSVGLVKPKPGVFQNFVKYLLVLTTTVEIVVLGVTFSTSKTNTSEEYEEMHLVPEPVFVLPTDGVSIISVKATAKGRIFLGGKDGNLYEITYQAQVGWFGKHCKKVNHSTSALSFLVPSFLNAALYDEDPIVKIEVDNSRHMLYTLSEKGCIEMFDLGVDGEGLVKVVKLSQSKIVSCAMDIVKTLEASNFKPVIAISAVDKRESVHLNLVAVTQTGARLYFSAGLGDIREEDPYPQRPQDLALLHVRLPPGFTPSASVLKPKQVHSAIYENGTLVMVCSSGGGGEAETVWCLSREGAGGGPLSEAHTVLALDGPAWALTPLPPKTLPPRKDMYMVSRWAVVTAAGTELLAVGAAPDLLRTLLRDYRGPDAQPIKDFFHLIGVEQACACAAYLACEEVGDPDMVEWATRAFYLYGGQPAPTSLYHQTSHHPSMASPKFSPRQVSTPMTMRGPQGQMPQGRFNTSGQQSQLNQSYPGLPNQSMMPSSPYQQNMMSPTAFNQSSFVSNMTHQQRDMNFPIQMEYTAKHNGLYIYIGRILTPIWSLKCVTKTEAGEEDTQQLLSSRVSGEECAHVALQLQRVAAFMQRVAPPPTAHMAHVTHAAHAHHNDENASLHALKLFINMAIEMLNLWKILCEHQFHAVAASLPNEQQTALEAAKFRELLVGGQEVAGLLLGSLVAGYLRDNASVDGISHRLRQLCPTLYRQEDATCSKANELLIFAKQQKNPAEREEMLHQALKLCKDIAPNVNLPLVCSKLLSAGFYSGVVELCVACAKKVDPQDKALHYYRSEQPSQDREGHLAYYRRMEIYREVTNALQRLYERGSEGGIDRQAGGSPLAAISPADANYQGKKLICDCLSRPDELLHVAVYEWLVSQNLGSEVLSLGVPAPPSLRTYLEAAARAAPPAAALLLLDLLWKVLQSSGEQLAAAAVLEGLATRPGGGATLAMRVQWLSAGVVCVRGAGAGGGELLRRLEEAGEVARVQAAVRAAAQALPPRRQPPPRAMQRLDDELLEITQLYEEYADRYGLWECKLAIVQCSGHNDPLLVESIWSHILSEAEAAANSLPAPDDRLASVLTRLTALAKDYLNTGHCFPLYFIVRQLEIMACKMKASKHLVFRTMLNIGVSIEQLLDIYIKAVSVKERVWLEHGEETHVCAVAALALEAARTELATLPAHARRRALVRCKDLHEAAVSSLQSQPNTQRLIERLTAAQAHLDRMD